jgi:hypothetical protein
MARRRAAKSASTAKRKTTRAKAGRPASKQAASPARKSTRAAKPRGTKSPAKRASSGAAAPGAAAPEDAPEAALNSLERLTGVLAESGEGVKREVTALGRGLRAGFLAGAEAFRKPGKRR